MPQALTFPVLLTPARPTLDKGKAKKIMRSIILPLLAPPYDGCKIFFLSVLFIVRSLLESKSYHISDIAQISIYLNLGSLKILKLIEASGIYARRLLREKVSGQETCLDGIKGIGHI